jgi:uncharacterized membrane protein YdjX (TVP38/TMEM64 family)
LHRRGNHRKWIVAAVLPVAAIAALSFLPLRGWAEGLQDWIERLGAAGVVLFAAIYVAATLLLLPVWILTVVAGAVFGIVGGLLLVLAASMAGAIGAFFIARYALKDRAKKLFARHELLGTVDKALRKAGWKVVALMRLSPLVPFTAQNYFYGTTTVKFAQFAFGTALGIVPGTMVEVVLGASGRAAMGAGPAHLAMLGVGVVATVVATWYIGRVARRKLGIR